jgi:hypothetical protein
MSELPLEEVPAASEAVHEAANGRVIHITKGVELEIVRMIDTPEATHLRYRVRR